MNVITIGDSTLSSFELILTAEALDRLSPGPGKKQDTFALGIVDGNFPLGAIAVKCDPPFAEVISLYVVEDFRRLGFGSQLVFSAITDCMTLPGITEFIIPYTEEPGEDVFTSFFNGLEMDIVDVGAEYRIRVSDAFDLPTLSKGPRREVSTQAWKELLAREQKILFSEGAGLYDYSAQGRLREDLVFVKMDESHRNYAGCIAVVEMEGELILAWLRAENSPFLMVELMRRVLQKLKENGEQDKALCIPTVNSSSDAMVQDLLGDTATLSRYSKRVVFDFEGEE